MRKRSKILLLLLLIVLNVLLPAVFSTAERVHGDKAKEVKEYLEHIAAVSTSTKEVLQTVFTLGAKSSAIIGLGGPVAVLLVTLIDHSLAPETDEMKALKKLSTDMHIQIADLTAEVNQLSFKINDIMNEYTKTTIVEKAFDKLMVIYKRIIDSEFDVRRGNLPDFKELCKPFIQWDSFDILRKMYFTKCREPTAENQARYIEIIEAIDVLERGFREEDRQQWNEAVKGVLFNFSMMTDTQSDTILHGLRGLKGNEHPAITARLLLKMMRSIPVTDDPHFCRLSAVYDGHRKERAPLFDAVAEWVADVKQLLILGPACGAVHYGNNTKARERWDADLSDMIQQISDYVYKWTTASLTLAFPTVAISEANMKIPSSIEPIQYNETAKKIAKAFDDRGMPGYSHFTLVTYPTNVGGTYDDFCQMPPEEDKNRIYVSNVRGIDYFVFRIDLSLSENKINSDKWKDGNDFQAQIVLNYLVPREESACEKMRLMHEGTGFHWRVELVSNVTFRYAIMFARKRMDQKEALLHVGRQEERPASFPNFYTKEAFDHWPFPLPFYDRSLKIFLIV